MSPHVRNTKKAKARRRKLKAQNQKRKLSKMKAYLSEPDALTARAIEPEHVKADTGETKSEKAETKGHEAKRKFGNIIARHVENHNLNEPDRIILRRLLGYGPLDNVMLGSDTELRRMAGVFLAEALIKLKQETPDLHFSFWTFTNDRGNTSDREPTIDLRGLHSMVDQVFRRLKLPSFSVAELQGLGNHPRQGSGRTIMAHVHAITWSTRPFDCRAIKEGYNSATVWRNSLGADPVHVRPITFTDGDLSHVAYYMLKPPYDVKMLEERKNGICLKSTEKGYKPEFAMRILEGLSQLEILTIVRSTYDGVKLRTEWQRRLTYWHKSRIAWSNKKLPEVAHEEFWGRIRSKKRRSTYLPYRIIR
jgi:hypothetical protein